jgi:hypothetical protein
MYEVWKVLPHDWHIVFFQFLNLDLQIMGAILQFHVNIYQLLSLLSTSVFQTYKGCLLLNVNNFHFAIIFHQLVIINL